MARKSCIAIIATIAVALLASLTHTADAQQGPLKAEANLLYTSKDVAGSLLPHFSENPAFGGGVSAKYPIGLSAFSSGINTAMAQSWNSMNMQKDNMATGHTGIFVAAERHLHPAHLSARTTYMHTSMSGMSSMSGNHSMYETILKAQLHTAKQKPYVFLGFLTPTDIPIQEITGLGGIGVETYTEVHENMAICTDSSIATTLLSVGKDKGKETVLRSRVALEAKIQDATKMQIGFNVFQDIERKEYQTWWNITATHAF